jgi:hypothetical protein
MHGRLAQIALLVETGLELHDRESPVARQHVHDHRAIARLEDVERHQGVRKERHVGQREDR